MKKLLTALLLATISFASFAGGGHHSGHHGHGYRHHGYHSYNYNWVAPTIIGGALIYGATRPYYYNNYNAAPVYYSPPMNLGPAIVNPIQPVAYWCAEGDGYFPQVQSCSDWQVVTK